MDNIPLILYKAFWSTLMMLLAVLVIDLPQFETKLSKLFYLLIAMLTIFAIAIIWTYK